MKVLKILGGVTLLFVLIQFIPVDRENPPVDRKKDFVDYVKPPAKIQNILKNACYDCHSNETKYPSYAYIAPISWSVKHHVNEGREHLNFSQWSDYNLEQKKDMLGEISENVEKKEMPMKGYILQHPEANLTEEDRVYVTGYFQQLLSSGKF